MHAQGQYLESFPLVRECIVTHNYHDRHVYDVLARFSPSMMDKLMSDTEDIGSLYLTAYAHNTGITRGDWRIKTAIRRERLNHAVEKGHILSVCALADMNRTTKERANFESIYLSAAQNNCPNAMLRIAQGSLFAKTKALWHSRYSYLLYPRLSHDLWVKLYESDMIIGKHVYTIECTPFSVWEPTHVVHRCCHPRVHNAVFEWLLVAGRTRGVDRYLKLLICSYIVTRSQWC
jgi:hypothetical protein